MGKQDVQLTREKIGEKEDLVRIVDRNFQADRDSKTYTQFETWAKKFYQGFDKVEQKGSKKIPDRQIRDPETQETIVIEIKDLQLSALWDKERGMYKMNSYREETKNVNGVIYSRTVDRHHRKTVNKLLEADKQLLESSQKGLQTIVILGRRFGKLYDYNKIFGLLGWGPVFSALCSKDTKNKDVEHKFEAISAVGGFVDTEDTDGPNNGGERLYLIRNRYARVVLRRPLPGCLFNN